MAIPTSGETPAPAAKTPRQGLLDTNILVLRRWIDPSELPDEMAISAVPAIAEELPLFTTNPSDYAGLEKLIRIVPVTRPSLPQENNPRPA